MTEAQKHQLEALIAQGEAVLASKKQPRSNIVGDWQSGETVYAVVDPELFGPWRAACLVWLAEVVGEESELWRGFEGRCRRAQYLEALAGQNMLLRVVKTGI